MGQLIVQKFGGSSVAGLDRIQQVAAKIAGFREQGKRIVAVISAMEGETDRLLELAKTLHQEPPSRELDVLVSTGELQSAALLSMALSSLGVPAVSFSGVQVPIRTTNHFGHAQILHISPQRIARQLQEGRVAIVAGFQGVTEEGEVTTLGRGGSDLTAVALASALGAEHCELYKDVSGIYTADPRLCTDARPIRSISYDEMLELAYLGARVIQARSVLLAKRYMIPIHVLSTFEDVPGTWVKGEEKSMEGTVVTAITCDRKEARISVRHMGDAVNGAGSLFSALAEEGINIDVIVQDQSADGKTNVTFTVPREDFERALTLSKKVSSKFPDVQFLSDLRIAKVSAVGLGMRTRSGVAAKVFRALAAEKIEVMAVSTSDIKISCVIDDRYAELAVRVLHDAFDLAKEPN